MKFYHYLKEKGKDGGGVNLKIERKGKLERERERKREKERVERRGKVIESLCLSEVSHSVAPEVNKINKEVIEKLTQQTKNKLY